MTGFTKLFADIISSSLWDEPQPTRIVFITMLALRNRDHVVRSTDTFLALASRVTNEEAQEALRVLSSPDPRSRSQVEEGRRIKRVDGGWFIINGEHYRKKLSLDERNEYKRVKQAEYRAKKKSGGPSRRELAYEKSEDPSEQDRLTNTA